MSRQDNSSPTLKRRLLYWFILAMFVSFCVIGGAGLGLYAGFVDDLPSLSPLEDYSSSEWNLPTRVYDRDGELLAEFYEERREIVDLEDLPPELIDAVVALEDTRFEQHHGVDFIGIARAAIRNIRAGRIVEGGSTLTQQLAKVLFLNPKQTFRRKFQEALLALRIEQYYTKEEILDRYLNKVYFGEGAYGIQAASRIYFGHDAEKLSLAEGALLAALPRAPSYYSPIDNPERVQGRHYHVLNLLVDRGWLTQSEVDRVYLEFWENYEPEPHRQDYQQIRVEDARYFVEEVRRRLIDRYGSKQLYRGGLTVQTTLDRSQQEMLQEKLHDHLLELNIQQENLPDTAASFEDYRDLNLLEGAAYLKDPGTGEVRALIGGHDWNVDNQLNRATQSQRQPGSAFKPILYSAALENDYTLADTLQDRPVLFNTPRGQWIPSNYTGRFYGTVTLRNALVKSLNVATIDLMNKVGPQNVMEQAQELGIQSPLSPNMAMALGGLEDGVSLAELTDVYATFANDGVRTNSYLIREVRDREQNVLEQNLPNPQEVLDPRVAHLVNHTLQQVVEQGTARSIGSRVDFPLAGKTGTTDDYRDAWFIGYTPDYVLGSWFGYDRARKSMGNNMSGGAVSAGFWWEVAPELFGPEPTPVEVPPGISYVRIDPKVGLRASEECSQIERVPFITGTAPTRRCGEPERSLK